MNRKEEFQKVKELIKKYYKYSKYGIYNTRNIVGDPMKTLYIGKYFKLEICYEYGYFEIFGTTNEEFEELEGYYASLRNGEELYGN